VVPGLTFDREFIPSIDLCCKQVNVPLPLNDQLTSIFEQSTGISLIIEAIVWIRKYSGTYPDAINQYKIGVEMIQDVIFTRESMTD